MTVRTEVAATSGPADGERNSSPIALLEELRGRTVVVKFGGHAIGRLTADALDGPLPGLVSGMRPKREGCLRAVRGGVRGAHVLDGRVANAVPRGVLGETGPGTTVVPDDGAELERHTGVPASDARRG